ncbi:MAG TPA: ABC transporter permease [Thermoanaerobaculia bacterium]|nr:ABC transporter permease [Thermoanaerobaculia bacterium]
MLHNDLRFALRVQGRSPGFTAMAVAILALGIGANAAIFSVVEGVLLRPLPFVAPERLVALHESDPAHGFEHFDLSPPNFFDYRTSGSFSGLGGYAQERVALTGEGTAEQVGGWSVTADFFPVLGVRPLLGRWLAPEEFVAGRDHEAVLSHRLWSRRFGADPRVLGRLITLDGLRYRVVGVMPAAFQFPVGDSEVWMPLTFPANVGTQRGAHYLAAVGRLRAGVTCERAAGQLSLLAGRLSKAYPDTNQSWTSELVPLRDDIVGRVRPSLLVLLGAVGLVALIACANISSLILARAAGRGGELAIRTALGATRGQLLRQLLTESLLLALAGGAAALPAADWTIGLIVRFGPQEIPYLDQVRINPVVLGFLLAITLLAGTLVGLSPALTLSRSAPDLALRGAGRAAPLDRRGGRLRGALVVVEMALALVLLTGAGLLTRSFLGLAATDPGFRPANVLKIDLALSEAKYPDGQRMSLFYDRLLDRLAAIPGVRSTGAVFGLPLTRFGFSSSFTIAGAPTKAAAEAELHGQVRLASRGYFATLGIPLLRGRLFDARDRRGAPVVVLASAAAARKYWPGGDAIGQRLRFSARPGPDRIAGEIVGIVGDVRDLGLGVAPRLLFYAALEQVGVGEATILVRTAAEPAGLAAAVRQQVRDLDPNLPVTGVATMQQVLSSSIAQPRFYMTLLALFAGISLLLAAIGIYGLMSYAVRRRTQEIGIRMALGAQPRTVLGMVIGQAAVLIAAGVGAGLLGSFGLTRLLSGILVGVSATDPGTFSAVPLLLAAVAVAASYLPARRAVRIDPLRALRDDSAW